ncbi:transposase [Candidatus Wolfebacteria bacterium]|nr:transposase [Candidatus Wolfebacteria bacterium]
MRNIQFTEGEIYHVYNRGIDKRSVFGDDKDRFRFIHDLFEFNDEEPAVNIYYKKDPSVSLQLQSYEAKPRKIERHKRKLIVELLAFCLMPNHFHLLLRQRKEGGISAFMHKLGTGYTMSFNQKYQRSGSLFQGSYKAILIKEESHFIHLPYYIHLNPLDLTAPGWREREIKDYKKAMRFLENYRWSSYLDYIGQKNFPSVTQRKFLLSFFEEPRHYKKEMAKWLKDIDIGESDLNEFTLE